jgi:hypothetical protein
LKKNEPIIPQKTLNQEKFKNPKKILCCIKTKKTHPNQLQEKAKKIKQNRNTKNMQTKYFESHLAR